MIEYVKLSQPAPGPAIDICNDAIAFEVSILTVGIILRIRVYIIMGVVHRLEYRSAASLRAIECALELPFLKLMSSPTTCNPTVYTSLT